jgi:hypothetical protein
MMAISVPIVAFLAHGFIVRKPYAQMEVTPKYVARMDIHIKPGASGAIKFANSQLTQQKNVTPHRTINAMMRFTNGGGDFFVI